MENSQNPYFSVILPTRNRPELLRKALESVLCQTFKNIEVLVVNDGSDDACRCVYQKMEEGADPRVRWFHQVPRNNGHGPSYSINTGAHAARGRYLCMLDDDDSWLDAEHLDRAHRVIEASAHPVDALYSNQRAFSADGVPLEDKLWLEGLADRLSPRQSGTDGTYHVTPGFLLGTSGFPHLNCTILRRALYLEIGGMDEGIRYECEVDLYLRTLDAATEIVYNPRIVARHNIPDALARNSVSTAVNLLERRLSQIRVYEKNLARAPSAPIRDACVARLAMLHKHLTEHFRARNENRLAALYARKALAYRWTVKWQIYSLYLAMKVALGNK